MTELNSEINDHLEELGFAFPEIISFQKFEMAFNREGDNDLQHEAYFKDLSEVATLPDNRYILQIWNGYTDGYKAARTARSVLELGAEVHQRYDELLEIITVRFQESLREIEATANTFLRDNPKLVMKNELSDARLLVIKILEEMQSSQESYFRKAPYSVVAFWSDETNTILDTSFKGLMDTSALPEYYKSVITTYQDEFEVDLNA